MTDRTAEARRAIALGGAVVAAIAAGGLLVLPSIARYRLWYNSAMYGQFAAIEPWWLVSSVVVSLGVILVVRGVSPSASDKGACEPLTGVPTIPVSVIAVVVFAVTLVGTYLVFHGFYFADDEYSAWVQAVIFAHGKSAAHLTGPWCEWIGALTPTSVTASRCAWSLSFLPVHSLIRSGFIAVRIDHAGGPAIAAASVLLLAAIGGKLWPARPDRTLIAVLTLALSTQFLVMSMTMYAMPTHLLFSLLWLWLFVEDTAWSVALLPLVGVVALGVHSPLPHAFWVLGLLVRYPWERRWVATIYIASVYLLGLMFWSHWLGIASAGAANVSTVAVTANFNSVASIVHTIVVMFRGPDVVDRLTEVIHLSLLQTWNAPIALICVTSALVMWKRLQKEMRYVALSFLLMIVARTFRPDNQGEGWGYRYAYTGLANLALLTAAGADVLREAVGSQRAFRLLVASAAFSLVALPIRGAQVEHIVRPYWKTSEMLSNSPGEVVVYPWHLVMWGRQLVRNDPFLRNKPKIMGLYELWPVKLNELFKAYPGQVRVVGRDDLERVGVPMEPSIDSLRNLVQ